MRARRWLLAVSCIGLLVCGVSASSSFAATHFGEAGGEAGQVERPVGLAVNQASGDVYVSELNSNRLDRFDSTRHFKLAWGWGVNEAAPAEELQTCTTACQKGSPSLHLGPDPFNPQGLAVDSEQGSSSYGDVYVYEGASRVSKYGPSGEFLLMFGGEVNETKDNTPGATESEKDVCVAREACKAGVKGSADGEFEAGYEASFVAVGPGGRVYVGDKARVQVFEPTGAWRESISLAGLSSTGVVTALAVDSVGDVFIADSGAAGVREFELGGIERAVQFDAASTSVSAITLDGSGNLYVADSSGGTHFLKYDISTGDELDSFGSNTVGETHGMAFSDARDELYATSFKIISYYQSEQDIWVFTPPPPGPFVESESATPELRGAATLEAVLNPEGGETAYHFEYVTRAQYEQSGFSGASSSTPATVGAAGDFEPHAVKASVTLEPGVVYEYRLAASNSQGTVAGGAQPLQETPAALIEGPWVSNVANTSATFAVKIDPLGASTAYRLEYGTTSAYGQTLSGSVGEGMGYVEVSFHRQGLEAATTYHYRVVTSSTVGAVEGPDRTFVTQPASGEELTLPDGRAWELVSPPNKHGALIEPNIADVSLIQAAADGSGIVYPSNEPLGEGARGKAIVAETLSQRVPGGWRTQAMTLPYSLPEEGTPTLVLGAGYEREYKIFSPDLSLSVVEPDLASPPLSSQATEDTLYVRATQAETFVPLVTPANVPPGTKYGPNPDELESTRMQFAGATPDLSNIVITTPAALTADAPNVNKQDNLYEWAAGRLQLVSILPDGTPSATGGVLGRGLQLAASTSVGAISADGRWIVWQEYNGTREYVRDMVGHKTIEIGGFKPSFQTMSRDGSKIVFLEKGELYEENVQTGAQVDLTAGHGAGENNAGVQESILGADESASSVYFVATGVLASGAHSGEDNLYLLRYNGSEWKTTYISTLSNEDDKSWIAGQEGFLRGNRAQELTRVSSRVSPNGRYVTFMSSRPLTGYDNIDANSGHADEEVFLYDAVTGRLACASCNPSGARPVGMLDGLVNGRGPFVDRSDAWTEESGNNSDHWLAGSVPGWRTSETFAVYQARYLSNDGRLFFESPDALVPQDINGVEDVYQYEPAGIGSCRKDSATFNEKTGGCVDLISSGASSSESAFYDASETGPGGEEAEDAFFVTAGRLVPGDYDTSYDVYDAHVCSGAAPCVAAPVSSPECTSGDSCKAAPSPQPEAFGPAPSATFSGVGNLSESSPATARVGKRSVSPARRRLSRALRTCRKMANKKRRRVCERRARKRFQASASRHGHATKTGSGR